MSTISSLLGANAIVRGVGQAFAAARGANPSAAGRASAASAVDTLEISPEAEAQLSKGAASSTGHGAASRVAPSWRIDDVRANYEMSLRELEQRLVALLKEADIEIGDGFQLEASADGHVVVVGHHALKPEIEQLFADHAELRELVQRLDKQAAHIFRTDSEATRRQQENLIDQHPKLRLTMTGAGLQANAH